MASENYLMSANFPFRHVFRKRLVAGVLAVFALARADNAGAAGGILVRENEGRVVVTWPIDAQESGEAVFNLSETSPLIESLAISVKDGGRRPIVSGLNPVTLVTVGSRDLKPSGWTAFF